MDGSGTGMNMVLCYQREVLDMLEKVFGSQKAAIGQASSAVAAAIEGGGVLHTFGTGHSHLLAEEAFYRAGGLVPVNPILDAGLLFGDGAVKSTFLERVVGYASEVLARHRPQRGDAMLLASNSGRNAVPIEMALLAADMGITTIAVTSVSHSTFVASRHPSGKKLMDVCHIVIDNGGVPGDAVVSMNGSGASVGEPVGGAVGTSVGGSVGAASTVVGAAIVNSIIVGAVEAMLSHGATPPVFASSNLDGGDESNSKWIESYRGRIRDL